MTRFYRENIDHEWLQTRSGGQFFPRDPDPDAIDPKELATVLSRIPRFSGHTREFYSVAQHSMLAANVFPEAPVVIRLAILLHDADEGYSGFGDLQAPIRNLSGSYREIKVLIDRAVESRFGLPARALDHPMVHEADMVALATEKRDLLEETPFRWARKLPDPLPQTITPWPMQRAAKAFLSMFHNLSRRWERERQESNGHAK